MSTWNDISRKVMAKCLLDPEAFRTMLRRCDYEDVSPRFRGLFVAMRNCVLEGKPMDVPAICELAPELTDTVLDLAVDDEVTGADQQFWVDRMIDCRQESRLTYAVLEMNEIVKTPRPFREKREKIMHLFAEGVKAERHESRLVSIAEALGKLDESFGPFVQFPPWDDIIGGVGEGRIHVLAGRTGMGKTTMAVQWARTASCPTLFIPLEIGHQDTATIAHKQGDTANMKILADPKGSWPLLEADLSWAIEASNAKIVIIDHLRFMHLAGRRERWAEVGDILEKLRQCMHRHRASCILVCQLNRQPENRRSQRPIKADLRDSGHVEEQANSVTFLWAHKEQRTKSKAEWYLTVDKNRDGDEGETKMVFDRPGRRFLLAEHHGGTDG